MYSLNIYFLVSTISQGPDIVTKLMWAKNFIWREDRHLFPVLSDY